MQCANFHYAAQSRCSPCCFQIVLGLNSLSFVTFPSIWRNLCMCAKSVAIRLVNLVTCYLLFSLLKLILLVLATMICCYNYIVDDQLCKSICLVLHVSQYNLVLLRDKFHCIPHCLNVFIIIYSYPINRTSHKYCKHIERILIKM